MGEALTARDTRIDRIVAIKISNERCSERFEREARAAAALNHCHICQLYDVGKNYFVMDYVDGARLGHVTSMRQLVDPVAVRDGSRDETTATRHQTALRRR